jgi:cell division protein FtsB
MTYSKKTYIVFGLLLCFIAVILFAWLSFGSRGLLELHRMQKEKDNYIAILDNLRVNNHILATEIRRLREDKKYFESVARKELGLIKDNEIIYRIKEDGTGTTENR